MLYLVREPVRVRAARATGPPRRQRGPDVGGACSQPRCVASRTGEDAAGAQRGEPALPVMRLVATPHVVTQFRNPRRRKASFGCDDLCPAEVGGDAALVFDSVHRLVGGGSRPEWGCLDAARPPRSASCCPNANSAGARASPGSDMKGGKMLQTLRGARATLKPPPRGKLSRSHVCREGSGCNPAVLGILGRRSACRTCAAPVSLTMI